MDNIVLTKDSDYLLCKIYKNYLSEVDGGNSPSNAAHLGGASAIREHIVPEWGEEKVRDICWQLHKKNMLFCFGADNTVYTADLTQEGIIYMENHFKNNNENTPEFLANEIYNTYMERIENGVNRQEAKRFMNQSVYKLLPKTSKEDAREILDELFDEFPPKYSYVHDFEISAEFISYMSNKNSGPINANGVINLPKKCFVVSQIGSDNSPERNHANDVYDNIISPTCSKFDIVCTRSDKIFDSDKISESIFTQLREADLVIADLTGKNPNVYLEVGFRIALEKPHILLAAEGEKLPFDVSNIRTIFYDTHFHIGKIKKSNEILEKTIKTVLPDTMVSSY